MYLVRIGHRTVNLEYLIKADDSALGAPPTEAPSGGIRVSVYPGESFDVLDGDADRLRLHLDDNIKPTPGPRPEPGAAQRPRAAPSRTGRSSKLKPGKV